MAVSNDCCATCHNFLSTELDIGGGTSAAHLQQTLCLHTRAGTALLLCTHHDSACDKLARLTLTPGTLELHLPPKGYFTQCSSLQSLVQGNLAQSDVEYSYLCCVFNAKVGREDIFKSIIGQDSFHQDSNDNGVRIVNFATSKNLVVKSSMFPHRNIHKYTWTSPDSKTHNQIDHVLIDRRWQSSVLDVRSFRGAECDTDHYLVIAKVRKD